MTTSTILYRIDTWFLHRQRLNEYAILTLTGYQQHYDEPCGFSGDHWQMHQCFNVFTDIYKVFLFPGIVPLLYSVGNKTYYYYYYYAMQADILPDIGTISIWWNSPSTSRRSFNVNRYRPTSLANINEKSPFRYRFYKGNAMLDRHIGRYQMI